MPERNRVSPRSDVVAIPLRGRFMGNRGCLHRGHTVVRNHAGRRWITCVTDYPARTVPQWSEGHYTVLFFHDEAVALAAGHRPCALCRRARYNDFRAAWQRADGGGLPSADEMDARLHAERLDGSRQRTHEAAWSSLPRGTFALLDGEPAVVLDETVVPWSKDGYGTPSARPSGTATVLTPPSTVAVLAAGYSPDIA
ncbi:MULTISPECIES: hypothetical protein [unclassified Rhodococcus (in: high G+C Gram-positive bacteria)]|uniref:hypothetical protein n=1 Tax=unclassified Rhodococcus (in: high G+C Gram-positive bacteria) TaxID=192944 RepID=UPI00163B5102|nr:MULTISPECIES: hypothetical protein [unclassified Rhodococcus (in: high G+C Gram-positive bacteria)]MBC2643178.1 hypothetical protein [Rhodococcus sp. 3A]MBC2892081.1 hypothetical protein [Rhodococcus sp. 4CII]